MVSLIYVTTSLPRRVTAVSNSKPTDQMRTLPPDLRNGIKGQFAKAVAHSCLKSRQRCLRIFGFHSAEIMASWGNDRRRRFGETYPARSDQMASGRAVTGCFRGWRAKRGRNAYRRERPRVCARGFLPPPGNHRSNQSVFRLPGDWAAQGSPGAAGGASGSRQSAYGAQNSNGERRRFSGRSRRRAGSSRPERRSIGSALIRPGANYRPFSCYSVPFRLIRRHNRARRLLRPPIPYGMHPRGVRTLIEFINFIPGLSSERRGLRVGLLAWPPSLASHSPVQNRASHNAKTGLPKFPSKS